MRKTATIVRDLPTTATGATQRLYRCDPPMVETDWNGEPVEHHQYVVASAVLAPFSGPETYIFPANEDGVVTAWGELDGSFRGGLDCDQAIRGAGYTVVSDEASP